MHVAPSALPSATLGAACGRSDLHFLVPLRTMPRDRRSGLQPLRLVGSNEETVAGVEGLERFGQIIRPQSKRTQTMPFSVINPWKK